MAYGDLPNPDSPPPMQIGPTQLAQFSWEEERKESLREGRREMEVGGKDRNKQGKERGYGGLSGKGRRM